MSNSSIVPTYNGYIHNTRDALAVIQQVLDKQLEPVSRRPHERERGILIVSGSVFVFIEQLSGIKRWTDGISWSPSRIQGRFLVYGELDKKNLIDKDKKKKKKRKFGPDDEYDHNANEPDYTGGYSNHLHNDNRNHLHKNSRSGPMLLATGTGSITHTVIDNKPAPSSSTSMIHSNVIPASSSFLTDYRTSLGNGPMVSAAILQNGLVKKTITLTTTTKELHMEGKAEKQTIHLISYYSKQDIDSGKLQRPSESDLKHVQISPALWTMVQENSLGGKAPIDDEECFIVDGHNQYTNVSYIQQQQQQHQLQHQPLLHHSSSVAGSTTSIVNNSSSISNGGYGNNYSKNLSRSYNKYSNSQVSQLLYMLPPQTESSSTATIASGASVSVKREDDTNNGSNAPTGNENQYVNAINHLHTSSYGGQGYATDATGIATPAYNSYSQANTSINTSLQQQQQLQQGQYGQYVQYGVAPSTISGATSTNNNSGNAPNIPQDVYYSHYTGFVQPHYPQYHIATGNASDQYNTNAANHQYHSNNTTSSANNNSSSRTTGVGSKRKPSIVSNSASGSVSGGNGNGNNYGYNSNSSTSTNRPPAVSTNTTSTTSGGSSFSGPSSNITTNSMSNNPWFNSSTNMAVNSSYITSSGGGNSHGGIGNNEYEPMPMTNNSASIPAYYQQHVPSHVGSAQQHQLQQQVAGVGAPHIIHNHPYLHPTYGQGSNSASTGDNSTPGGSSGSGSGGSGNNGAGGSSSVAATSGVTSSNTSGNIVTNGTLVAAGTDDAVGNSSGSYYTGT